MSKYDENFESELEWKPEKIKCRKEQSTLEFTNRVISAQSERISPQDGGRTNVYEVCEWGQLQKLWDLLRV
jgi:hypothetical protein